MNRNKLFAYSAALAITALYSGCNNEKNTSYKKPNIILILTDQQSAEMMSCAGNNFLKTPAMDYLANNGIRFTRAYTTNPVCSPARVSLLTGRFAGAFNDTDGNQVRENVGSMKIPRVSDEVLRSSLPAFLRSAGYDLFYGGKEHLPLSLNAKNLGFTDFSDDERDLLASESAEYIKMKHQNPYFMMISLINPHDICYMAIRDFAKTDQEKRLVASGFIECATLDSALQIPEGVTEQVFFEKYCPPLPPNYEPQIDEPEAIKSLIERRDFRKNARDNYSDNNWRMHRWAYCRLTEIVDRQVQIVLNALKESGQEENTLLVFCSDHGDNDASHHLEHKTVLYEESANVPFLVMWKGHIKKGKVDEEHLVSTGLDLLPTFCDYAGINGAADPRGRSLRPLFEGLNTDWRETLGVESEIGRMVVSSNKLKYIKYDAVGIEEQLLDLKKDPYETTHFTKDPAYKEELNALKKAFETEWFPGY